MKAIKDAAGKGKTLVNSTEVAFEATKKKLQEFCAQLGDLTFSHRKDGKFLTENLTQVRTCFRLLINDNIIDER